MAATSIHDLAIKLGVDSTGVATGMQHASAAILQSARERERAETIEREYNIKQQLDAQEAAEKARIKMEADFQKWYAAEMEREVAIYTAAEEAKLAEQKRASQERIQLAIYEHNMQQMAIVRPVAAETNERAAELIALREDMQERARILREAEEMNRRQVTMNMKNAQDRHLIDQRELAQRSAFNAALVAQAAERYQTRQREIQQRITTSNIISQIRAQEAERQDNVLGTTDAMIQRELDRVRRNQRRQFEEFMREGDRVQEEIQARERQHAEWRQKQANEVTEALVREAEEEQARITAELKQGIEERASIAAQREARLRKQMADAEAVRLSASARRESADEKRSSDGRILISDRSLRAIQAYVGYVEEKTDLEQQALYLKKLMISAEDAHTARLATYNRMLELNILTEKEYNLAVQESIRIKDASIRGFGQMGGALTQASYAVEDFIQVMSMGGGFNMAVMSASNNLSMVARSLIGTQTAMAAIAGFGVPVVLIGLSMLIRYAMDTEDQLQKLNDEFDELAKGLKRIHELSDIRFDFMNRQQDIRQVFDVMSLITDSQEATNSIRKLKLELKNLEDERNLNAERMRQLLFGGEEGSFEMLIQSMIIRARDYENAGFNNLAQTLRDRTEAMQGHFDKIQNGLSTGDIDAVLASAKELRTLYELATAGQTGAEAEQFGAMLERMQLMLDDEEKVKELRDEMLAQGHDREVVEAKINNLIQERKDLEEQLQVAQFQRMNEAKELLHLKQQETLAMLKATDVERDIMAMEKERMQFLGADGFMPMGIGGMLDMAFMAQQNLAFLMAQRDALVRDMAQAVPESVIKGGLEQNAFDAQARAFEQAMQAPKKPDPQLERQIKLLEAIEKGIANGGVIKIVP